MRKPARARLAAALAAVVGASLIFTGCAAGAEPTAPNTSDAKPVRGGNLNVAIPNDPGSLDFVAKPNLLAAHMGDMIFEKLFEVDKNYEPKPMLVDSFEKSDDGTKYTFTLRDGVTFHDGSPLTTDDVIASLNRWFTMNATGKLIASQVADVTPVNELTFEINLTAPRYGLIGELTASSAGIYQAKQLQGIDAAGLKTEQLVGTGPYMLTSWDVGQKVVFERYDGYKSRDENDWGGQAGAKNAYLDTVTYTVVGDEDAMLNGLKAGRWDYGMPSNDKYEAVKADPNLTVATWSSGNVNYILPNQNEASIFSNVKAREGLNLILDREALNAVAGGSADITSLEGGYAMTSNKGMHSTAGEKAFSAHDPKKGKKLLDEAGLQPGQVLRIVTTEAYPQLAQWAVVMQQQLKDVGVEAKIDTYDFTAMLATTQTRPSEWDISMMLYNGSFATPSQFAVMQGFADEGKAKVAAYDTAKDESEARKAVDEIQQFIWDELPAIAISHSQFYAAYSKKLQGYDNFYRIFYNAWLTK